MRRRLSGIILLGGALVGILSTSCSRPPTPDPVHTENVTPTAVKLGRIAAQHEIVYHADGLIYVMDGNGEGVTQVTFTKRHYEHVAVSHDRKRIVANEWARPKEGGASSRLWLFDLEQGTEVQLLPNFRMAGNGGVDWDPRGFIYFAGVERTVVPNPRKKEDFIANAAANDVYKVRWDGTGLIRLTNTPDRGEADVQVSADGMLVTCMATKIDPGKDYTEIWIMNSDGTNARLLYEGGRTGLPASMIRHLPRTTRGSYSARSTRTTRTSPLTLTPTLPTTSGSSTSMGQVSPD